MTTAEIIERLRLMRENVTGAVGMAQRKDRRALDAALAILEKLQP